MVACADCLTRSHSLDGLCKEGTTGSASSFMKKKNQNPNPPLFCTLQQDFFYSLCGQRSAFALPKLARVCGWPFGCCCWSFPYKQWICSWQHASKSFIFQSSSRTLARSSRCCSVRMVCAWMLDPVWENWCSAAISRALVLQFTALLFKIPFVSTVSPNCCITLWKHKSLLLIVQFSAVSLIRGCFGAVWHSSSTLRTPLLDSLPAGRRRWIGLGRRKRMCHMYSACCCWCTKAEQFCRIPWPGLCIVICL